MKIEHSETKFFVQARRRWDALVKALATPVPVDVNSVVPDGPMVRGEIHPSPNFSRLAPCFAYTVVADFFPFLARFPFCSVEWPHGGTL